MGSSRPVYLFVKRFIQRELYGRFGECAHGKQAAPPELARRGLGSASGCENICPFRGERADKAAAERTPAGALQPEQIARFFFRKMV